MFAGFDIGGTGIKGVITDSDGKILRFSEIPTPINAAGIDKAVLMMLNQMNGAIVSSGRGISAIGIGAAGSIDRNRGVIITSPNIPVWRNYPICRNIEKLTGLKVYLENDATAACAGIWWQTVKDKYSNWIMLTLGTGIGGGAVIDGRLFTGQSGSSMEVGHMSLDPEGPLCPCGNRGCFELYSSATALVKYVKSKMRNFPESSLRKSGLSFTAKNIYDEALKGDKLSLEGFEHISEYLGIGIANLINLFNPEAIIIGGGLSRAHKLLLPGIRRVVKERAMKGLKERVKFVVVKEQAMIAALGAAKIAKERHKPDY